MRAVECTQKADKDILRAGRAEFMDGCFFRLARLAGFVDKVIKGTCIEENGFV